MSLESKWIGHRVRDKLTGWEGVVVDAWVWRRKGKTFATVRLDNDLGTVVKHVIGRYELVPESLPG